MALARRHLLMVVLFVVPGIGIALNFTLLRKYDDWAQITTAVVVFAAALAAGWFSRSLLQGILLPFIVLACLALAFAVYGVGSSDVGAIRFLIFVSVIYGSLTFVAFVGGAIANRIICLISRKIL